MTTEQQPDITEQQLEFSPFQLRAMLSDRDFTQFSVQYADTRSRQLEGTFPNNPTDGVWATTGQRISRGWGAVTESDWPYCGTLENWPPDEPPGLDEKAKKLRSFYYQRIRSANEIRLLLGKGFPVCVNIEITEQWYDAPGGVIRLPDSDDAITGSHAVILEGFHITNMFFHFTNSWGPEWGNEGKGVLSFEYLDKYFIEAWAQYGHGANHDDFNVNQIADLSWGLPDELATRHNFGNCVHGREIYDGENDERCGWTFMLQRFGYLDIEELFVKPDHRRLGYGTRLVNMIKELRDKSGLPLRFWFSFADWESRNIDPIRKFLELLELTAYWSEESWAPAVAVNKENYEQRVGESLAPELDEINLDNCQFPDS